MKLNESDIKDKMEKGGSNQNIDICLLSSNLSAEIENQVKPILGFTNLLLEEELKQKDMKEFLHEIRSRSFELYSITIKLKELSIILSGDYKLKIEQIDLQNILIGVRKKFKKINKIQGNKLRIQNKQKEKKYLIYSDKNALTKIISNLVEIAISFTNYVKISIRTEVVEEKYLELLVNYTGIGIPEESRQKIFDPYFITNNDSEKGAGAGLTFIKAYINILDGEIELNSGINGSSIKALIPLKINNLNRGVNCSTSNKITTGQEHQEI